MRCGERRARLSLYSLFLALALSWWSPVDGVVTCGSFVWISRPNINLLGLSPVALWGVFWYADTYMSTASSGSTPSAYAVCMAVLSPLLNLSTVPFAGGWYGVVLFGFAPQSRTHLGHSLPL